MFATIALTHAVYVSLYAVGIPFWDQWDGLNQTIRPWLEGGFDFAHLFAPHNEHRVAFTRIITLALFSANGGIWDNRVEAYANTLIYAGMMALLVRLLLREEPGSVRRWVLLLFAAVLGALPFGWENTLVGFQNQFYLMTIGAFAMIGAACYAPARLSSAVLLLTLGVASLFTMASGLLASVAAAMLLMVRAWTRQLRASFALWTSSALVLVAAMGFWLMPHLAYHDVYRAKGLLEHLHALLVVLVWPASLDGAKHAWLLVAWAPSCLWLARTFRSRTTTQGELVVAGVAGWALLQALAIAHARGHGLVELPSRYTDIPAVGLLANAALALRYVSTGSLSPRARWAASLAVAGILGALVLTLARRAPVDAAFMRQRLDLVEVQQVNVLRYLATGDASELQQPTLLIPYPNATSLQRFLDTPALRNSLSVEVASGPAETDNPALAYTPATPPSNPSAPLTQFADRAQARARALFARFGYQMPDPMFREMQGPFSAQAATAAATPGMCGIDGIDWKPAQPETSTRPNGALTFFGWAVNPRRKALRRLSLLLVGPRVYLMPGKTGIARPDVARVMRSRKAVSAGFYVSGKLPDVPLGRYEVIVATQISPSMRYCRSGKWVLVGQAN